jgi:hypothetical protein
LRFSELGCDTSEDTEADELVKAAARKIALHPPPPPDVFFQTLEDSSVKTIELELRTVNVIQGEDW